jgi:hypothetical protein
MGGQPAEHDREKLMLTPALGKNSTCPFWVRSGHSDNVSFAPNRALLQHNAGAHNLAYSVRLKIAIMGG